MATQTEERGGAQTDRKLHRDVSTLGLLFFSLGSIIGSGWLLAPLTVTAIAGPAAIIAWVVGGAIMLILALVHAELGSMAGFTIGWIVWVGSVTVAPIEVLAVTTYGIHFFPWMMTEQEVLSGAG